MQDQYLWHLFAKSRPPARLVAFGGPADGKRLALSRREHEYTDADGRQHVYVAGRVKWSDARPVFVYMGPKSARPPLPPKRFFDEHVDPLDFDDCGFPSE